MRVVHVVWILVVAFLLGGCVGSTTQSGSFGVKRNQLMLVSSDELNTQANVAYAEVITEAKQKGKLNTNKELYNKLQTISKKLIAQVGVFRSDALNWDWQVNLIDEDTLNAWCMPGGKIAFYTGIINQLKLNDDEIAAIMGHEMAHALREHSREQASQDQLAQIGLFAVQKATNASDNTMKLANMAAYYTFTLPYSREHESESDIMGVELMARAGYNPNASISVWEKMSKVSQSNTPEFLSTHPSNENRIKELQKVSAEAMVLYNQANKK